MGQPHQAMQPFSPEAYQATSAYQLGAPQAEFKAGFSRQHIWALILGVVLAGLFGFAMTSSSSSLWMSIFVLIGIACIVWAIIDPIVHAGWRVYVCQYGVLFMKGSRPEVFRWEQVQSMWQEVTRHYRNGIYTGTTHKYTVQRTDGLKVVFNDRFKKVEDLGNSLSRAITATMLPNVLAAYNAGQQINFGPLSVSQQGVSNGREVLPWYEIKEFGVNKGIVSVRKEGKWLNWSTIGVSKIPNFAVFMALTQSILDQTRGRR